MKVKARTFQAVFLEYKSHSMVPGPELLRHRIVSSEVASRLVDIKIAGMRELRSLVLAQLPSEWGDLEAYNSNCFADPLAPTRSYIEGLTFGGQSPEPHVLLELLQRANLSADLWEGRLVHYPSKEFSLLLDKKITWLGTENVFAPGVANVSSGNMYAQIGAFPDEYLYSIWQNGQQLGLINDWPPNWQRIPDRSAEVCLLPTPAPNIFERLALEWRSGAWSRPDPRLEKKFLLPSL